MQIKTNDGTYSVGSNGKTNTALGLGIAGLATALLGGNIFGGGIAPNTGQNTPDGRFVTKAELDMSMQLQAKDLELAKCNSALALKESESYTDKKLVEVYANVETQINRVSDRMEADRRAQEQINAQQMAYNAAANANIDVLKSQVASLTGVTKVYIPSSNICQSNCCGCNS